MITFLLIAILVLQWVILWEIHRGNKKKDDILLKIRKLRDWTQRLSEIVEDNLNIRRHDKLPEMELFMPDKKDETIQ